MAPILGIMASQISGHLWAPSGAYDSIATTTLGSAASSITFSSIPQTYTHLQVRLTAKESGTGTGGPNVLASMNSDTTGSNYYLHYLFGEGSAANSGGLTAAGYYYLVGNTITSNASYANMFSSIVFDVLDYTNTNKYKTMRSLWGGDRNGSGEVGTNSSLWKSTSAISSITLSIAGGTNFTQYTSASLYGIKGN